MINKSFHLLRTNPLLTTNFKVVVTSDYNLYLESFNTNNELSNVKFKHFKMQKTDFLENKIPYFYKNLPIELAFDVKYDNDNNVAQTDYNKQFDTTYFTGAGYVEDQWYEEEFDYFAPLYIRKDNLPTGFIILRVDNPSSYNSNINNNYELNSVTANNFHEIIDSWKCVKYFDMKYESNLGEWLYNNYANNDRFPKSAFDYHAERAEFSNWYGIDYSTGVYTNKPLFMDDRNEIETPHFKWEKYITEGYKRSGLIYPYILNLKFLFDDTPATPSSLRKYSMNRYYGFYLENLEYVGSITSYRTPELIDTYLVNNIIVSGNTGMTDDNYCKLDYYGIPSLSPFKEKWDDTKEYYVFVDNTTVFDRIKTISGFYQVQRHEQNGQWIYKIISDDILDEYWNTGNTYIKTVDINYNNNYNILSGFTNDFFIDKYVDCEQNNKFMYGDLYLINIDNKYHVIKYSSGSTLQNELTINPITGDFDDYKYYIQTDYAINLNQEYLEYWILGKNSEYYNNIPVKTAGSPPLTFPIYRVKFSDIKDFDFDRVDTQYSDFDYEKTEYINTDEEKLFAYDWNDESLPPDKRIGKSGYSGQFEISSISSEYIADDELYEVFDKSQQSSSNLNTGEDKIYELNDIWRKNQSIVKWGFMGSISHSDYPYKLNNNYEVGGPYNRTCDPFYTIPDAVSKNMDYFYRLGNFYNSTNPVSTQNVYYKNQTTNIQWDFITGSGTDGTGFDIEAYFGGKDGKIMFDYFTFFFKNKMYYENNSEPNIRTYDKYSVFNNGDQNSPSITLFKGLKVKIKNVKNIYTNEDNKITKILYGDKTYNNYKLSIIFNENYNGANSGIINNNNYIDTNDNIINIILNEKFENILIIINAKITNTENDNDFLNDLNTFNEKDGLYYGLKKDGSILTGYNPNLFTAQNFINSLNDYTNGHGLTVKYYYIKEDGGVMYRGTSLLTNSDSTSPNFSPSSEYTPMTNIPNWVYPFTPFILNIETPVPMSINNNCYSTYPYFVDSVEDDYVSTILEFDETKSFKTLIYRFSGPYEPIFKNINIFKGGSFCYNNQTKQEETLTGSTLSNSSTSFNIPDPTINFDWINVLNICDTSDKYVEVNAPSTVRYDVNNEAETKYLSIRGFDFSNIPSNATINGITMTMVRKSFVNDDNNYVREHKVFLAKNCYESNPDFFSKNMAQITADYTFDQTKWSTELTAVPYGSDTDTWGDISSSPNGWSGSTLLGSDLSNPLFGVIIKVIVKNLKNGNVILPQIKCVNIKVKYTYTGITYTHDSSAAYFDHNYKFDTNLTNFGKIDELIYSKVNENIDVLRYSPEKYHIYPTIDNYGYAYSDRFIFKSSWDKEFFIKTESTLKESSGINE